MAVARLHQNHPQLQKSSKSVEKLACQDTHAHTHIHKQTKEIINEGTCRVSDSHLYRLTCFQRQFIIKEFKKGSLPFNVRM